MRAPAMTALAFVVLALGGCGGGDDAATRDEGPDYLALGDELTSQFYQGDLKAISQQLPDQLREEVGGVDGLQQYRSHLHEHYGTEQEVLAEQVTTERGHTVYFRRVRYAKLERPFVVQWAWDEQGELAGFHIQPVDRAKRQAKGDTDDEG